MRTKKYWLFVLVLAIGMAIGAAGSAALVVKQSNKRYRSLFPIVANLHNERDTLTGLKGVLVVVEDVCPEAQEAGLTRQQLQTDIELTFRQAGIKLYSKDEWDSDIQGPMLRVAVTSFKLESLAYFVYDISVKLSQRAFLLVNPPMYNDTFYDRAITWGMARNIVGMVNSDKFTRKVRETTKDEIDAFINDYLAANSKPKSEGKK